MALANNKKPATVAMGKENQKPTGKENAKPTGNKLIHANPFAAIEKIDGNPQTPQEFDEYEHGEEEYYFRPDEDADEDQKRRCVILNYIHTRLHVNMPRTIPAMLPGEDKFEFYHREVFQGIELDVCVYYPPKAEANEFRRAFAVVKVAGDMLDGPDAEKRVIGADCAWTSEAQNDPFTVKFDNLNRNYWIPRWKYVVKYLSDRMWSDFEKNGVEVEREAEPENVGRGGGGGGAASTTNGGGGGADYDDGSEQEEMIEVFSGITGRIIGHGGTKIKEIRAETNIADIELPKRDDSAPRPRARDMVNITLKGTRTAINKVKAIIQEISDEWTNTPRPPRDGGGGGGGRFGSGDSGYGGGGGCTAAAETYPTQELPGGTDEKVGNWGDDANEEAAATAGW